jgi:PAS domain S-box-containing protein
MCLQNVHHIHAEAVRKKIVSHDRSEMRMTTDSQQRIAQSPQWQALLDSAGEGIWGLDLDGNCTFVNRRACELFGYASGDMVGRDMHLLVHHHHEDGTSYPSSECAINRVIRDCSPLRYVRDTLFRADGSTFMAELSAEPVLVDGEIYGAVVTFRDITAQYHQQQELQRAHKMLEERSAEVDAIIESLPHGVYIATRDGRTRSNAYGRTMFGDAYGDALPGKLNTLTEAMAGRPAAQTENIGGRWIQSAGAPIRLNGELLGGVAVNTDVTQMRLQHDALRRSEKLAAVGQLASSIAHEINNPLESITNLLYLIRNSDQLDEISQYAQLAQLELARVTEITMQTLRFHRQQSRPIQVDLADLLKTILTLYTGRLLVRNIRLSWHVRPAPLVFCLEGEMRQVLNNLIRNAVDAMNETKEGRLCVCVKPLPHPKHGAPGVRLAIHDTGEGVPPQIRAHLYEPFHTSKEATGTGLGLWVSKGIVDKHGGSISMRTRRGKQHGTAFSVWLPIKPAASLSEAARVA